MKVKEVIEFVRRARMEDISKYTKYYNAIRELIEQGEKYKVMVWKINNEILSDEYDPIYIGDDPNKESLHNRIKNIIHEED